jgi:uncharacterized membrane protein (DUF485 family)
MKQQISRFSPHQNGKVFAVLMAITSLIFVVPFFLMFTFAMPAVDSKGNPVEGPGAFILLLPLLYLVMGYLMTVIMCWLYNFLARFTGGLEYETKEG